MVGCADANGPNQDEIARLEAMHDVLNRLFDNRLIFPPVRSPRRILDLGCGAGDWAMDVAMQYPNAEVRSGSLLFLSATREAVGRVPFSRQAGFDIICHSQIAANVTEKPGRALPAIHNKEPYVRSRDSLRKIQQFADQNDSNATVFSTV